MLASELSILALFGLLVTVTLVIQVLLALPQLGLPYLAGPRDAGKALEGVAARALRCLENSVVAMALFGPAVLIHAVQDSSTSTTLLLAQIFLLARVVYVPIYLLGIPWVRTLVWLVGIGATLLLFVLALLPTGQV